MIGDLININPTGQAAGNAGPDIGFDAALLAFALVLAPAFTAALAKELCHE